MRPPSSTLVVDAAILVATVRGRSSGALIEAARAANLVTTDRVVQEARQRIALGLKQPELMEVLDALIGEMTIVPVAAFGPILSDAEIALRDAGPSRNRSARDAHVVALAWSVEGDVWTTGRDFSGTGISSWSTPNLMRAFRPATSGVW